MILPIKGRALPLNEGMSTQLVGCNQPLRSRPDFGGNIRVGGKTIRGGAVV